ncbi:peroxiredoxin [Maribellus sediminis]|uniref:peroxiredoxin n=1 Tax=Maribellus sediminis TaxID=2696285 RepID=UPI0014303B34|nr:peroxiredoxin [Maribellus sediminis]
MKSVGEKFPKFKKEAVLANNQFDTITNEDHKKEGKWMVIFFYPKDFTFVCPTEIVEFNNNFDKFNALNATLYGVSTDTQEVHLAWKANDPRLSNLRFPLIEDTSKSLCKKLGILQPGSVAYRATFIVDPEGTIQWVNCNNDTTGRNVQEVLRALEATQNPGLTGCDWQPGDTLISVN